MKFGTQRCGGSPARPRQLPELWCSTSANSFFLGNLFRHKVNLFYFFKYCTRVLIPLLPFQTWLFCKPERLGVLSANEQLWGGGSAGGVSVTQRRVPDKLSERNPAAFCRHLRSCWTTAHKKARRATMGTTITTQLVYLKHLLNIK